MEHFPEICLAISFNFLFRLCAALYILVRRGRLFFAGLVDVSNSVNSFEVAEGVAVAMVKLSYFYNVLIE